MNKRYCNRCGQLEDRENMRVVTLIIHGEAEYFSVLCSRCITELKDFYNKRGEKNEICSRETTRQKESHTN